MPVDGREMPDSAAGGTSPHTLKSLPPLLERRGGEQDVHEAPRVALELATLGRGVPVAEQQDVDLGRGRAVLFDLDERPWRRRRGTVDEHVLGVHVRRPDVLELVSRIALPDDHLHGCVRRGKTERLVKRPVHLPGFVGRLPFPIDRGKAARVHHAPGGVPDFEEVLAQVRPVDRLVHVARPLERLDHDPIDAEQLLLLVPRVVVVEPHRPWRGERAAGGEKEAGRHYSRNASRHVRRLPCSHTTCEHARARPHSR